MATTEGGMVALLRGINVGKAKRVAMADLRALTEALGYIDVRTLLNSGNVTFCAPGVEPAAAAARIEESLRANTGVSSRTIALSAAEVAEVVEDNALADVADNASRLLVWVFEQPEDGSRLASLLEADWSPEALAVGRRAAYLWCPNGIAAGRLPEEAGRLLRDTGTARNWATVLKIHAILNPPGDASEAG